MFDTGAAGSEVGGMSVEAKRAACEEQGGEWVEPTGDHGHCSKPVSEEQEITEETPLKEWYSNQLHEALLRKFKIKK